MKEENSAYIVKAKIKSRIYYLVDYDFTISMTKENAMIFTNKNIAEKISGLLERKYETNEPILSADVEEIRIYNLFKNYDLLQLQQNLFCDEHKK